MQVLVISEEEQFKELITSGQDEKLEMIRLDVLPPHTEDEKYDTVIDLEFENTPDRIKTLKNLGAGLVIINNVEHRLTETDASFIRINGWKTFLKAPVIEAAFINQQAKEKADEFFILIHKKLKWLPDEPGLVSARVISMIINEAYLAMSEELSTKQEIDTAMKLGTGYPMGPFEWAESIGVKKVESLLKKMAEQEPKYAPALSRSLY
ncbi:MAG TPA: 3-hydroxyacyl-CoA dehydrogenase family protein [Chitinophagaceae bacterium]